MPIQILKYNVAKIVFIYAATNDSYCNIYKIIISAVPIVLTGVKTGIWQINRYLKTLLRFI